MSVFCVLPGKKYTLELDEKNQIFALSSTEFLPYYRDFFGHNQLDDHKDILKNFFKYMIILDSEQFEVLCKLLKENDPKMFPVAKEAIDELLECCLTLSKVE